MGEMPAERMRARSEVAGMLGVTEKTLREWERARRGTEVVRFSRKVARYPADSVSRFIASHAGAVPAEVEARR